MSHYIVYELDEFRPWPELSIYVYGSAEISYCWEKGDRDVGEWPGPCDIELHLLEINDHEFETRHVIDKAHPLFKAIENALQENPSVWDACRNDYES